MARRYGLLAAPNLIAKVDPSHRRSGRYALGVCLRALRNTEAPIEAQGACSETVRVLRLESPPQDSNQTVRRSA